MKKYQPGVMDNLGFPYDLKSIMQYEKTAFAKSEGLVTMEAWSDPDMVLGSQNAMSAADIMKINKLYNCPGSNDLCKYIRYKAMFLFIDLNYRATTFSLFNKSNNMEISIFIIQQIIQQVLTIYGQNVIVIRQPYITNILRYT